MPSRRHIVHIDMDAFFASIEQMDNPKLSGRPLIVGGDPKGRGVVAACSYEARKFGVRSALSSARAIKLCPHALFVRPRKDRYKEVSRQIMTIFKESAPLIEPLSLDEAFLDVSDNHSSIDQAASTAEAIRNRIFNEVGLSCSAGVSYNKFLAKIASDLNKPDGLSIIRKRDARSFLESLAISDFHGVGKVTAKKMYSLRIHCGRDLLRFERAELSRHFGKAGSYFYDIVRGIDLRPVEPRKGSKSIGTETTLATDILDMQQILEILATLSQKVACALKKKDIRGTTLTLKVRYHDFKTITRSHTFSAPIQDFEDIIHTIPQLLGTTDAGKKRIRLLGVTVSNLLKSTRNIPRQLTLPFD